MRGTVFGVALICVFGGPVLAETALPVEIIEATATAQQQQIVLSGLLQAVESFQASFRDGGRVLTVAVRAGDRVEAGMILAEIDPTQATAAERVAQANLDGAEAALRQAKLASDRVQGLLARGTSTRAEVDAATEAMISAQSTRDAAAAQLAKAQTRLEETVLRAARAGTVTRRVVDPGSVVGAGQEVVTIAADSGLDAVFNVPDGVELEAFVGAPISVSLIDSVDTVMVAKLSEISPLVDANTGTVQIKARIVGDAPPEVPFGAPIVGRMAMVAPPGIAVPWTALTATATGPAVWTVDPGSMRVGLTAVEVDAYGSQSVRLRSGLSDGALVVGEGSQLLFPGRVVMAVGDKP